MVFGLNPFTRRDSWHSAQVGVVSLAGHAGESIFYFIAISIPGAIASGADG